MSKEWEDRRLKIKVSDILSCRLHEMVMLADCITNREAWETPVLTERIRACAFKMHQELGVATGQIDNEQEDIPPVPA